MAYPANGFRVDQYQYARKEVQTHIYDGHEWPGEVFVFLAGRQTFDGFAVPESLESRRKRGHGDDGIEDHSTDVNDPNYKTMMNFTGEACKKTHSQKPGFNVFPHSWALSIWNLVNFCNNLWIYCPKSEECNGDIGPTLQNLRC